MTDTAKIVEISGELVRLRLITENDRASIVAIRSTEEVQRRWRGEDLDAEFTEDLDDDEAVRLAIEDQTGRVIGLIQFGEEEDPDYRHASIDIYIDPAAHRQGYATDAISCLVDYLFDEEGHHRLIIDPAVDNEAAIGCYTKVGFKPVGIMRSYERQGNGQWADGLLMDMLASDRT